MKTENHPFYKRLEKTIWKVTKPFDKELIKMAQNELKKYPDWFYICFWMWMISVNHVYDNWIVSNWQFWHGYWQVIETPKRLEKFVEWLEWILLESPYHSTISFPYKVSKNKVLETWMIDNKTQMSFFDQCKFLYSKFDTDYVDVYQKENNNILVLVKEKSKVWNWK